MPITFANPMGLFALLAVPAVLAIHFLQRRTRMIPVSTLFLIDPHRDQSRMGRRFDRLITSVPLWLQLLMALLLAAHLAQPRLPAADSVLRIAVVVDDSASMRVAKADLARHLEDFAGRHHGVARRIEWLVLPADPAKPRLYAGDSVDGMLASLEPWQPVSGPIDPTPTLRLARERVGAQGTVVYATDTPRDNLPADAVLLAVGKVIDNVGCTGVVVSEKDGRRSFEAMISNHGRVQAERSWYLECDGSRKSAGAVVSLPAGGAVSVGGPLPEGAGRLKVVLQPDEFALDDQFPFLAPEPKRIYFRHQLGPDYRWLPDRVAKSVPGMKAAEPGTLPDLMFAASADGRFPTVTGAAILFSSAGGAAAKTLADPVVAVRHPLMDGLLWETLSVQDVPMVPAEADDLVLLWSGGRPLLSLRSGQPPEGSPPGTECRQLVIHFNPNRSNWERLPAAAVLFLRYCESVRLAKRGLSRDQLEPGQALGPLLPDNLRDGISVETLDAAGKTVATRTLPGTARPSLTAPDEPGYLRVSGDGTPLIDAAVAFADAREGNFRSCATRLPESRNGAASEANDALARWWTPVVLLILAALLGSWAYAAREAKSSAADPANQTT